MHHEDRDPDDAPQPARDEAGRDLAGAALAWADQDPDPATAAALRRMVAARDDDALASHVGRSLAFGTAGLRGEVGPGPNRMNRAVVIRASQGLADHLVTRIPDAARRGVVVGHDARPDSARFAADVVAVVSGNGIDVAAFEEAVPTPVVAWVARQRGAAGAVVVTASHNPPADNGYKVYDEHGVQITPPRDAQIAADIDAAPGASTVLADLRGRGGVTKLGRGDVAAYEAAMVDAWREPDTEPVRVVVTPMHGVGGAIVERVLGEELGHDVVRVDDQWAPDGTFPTVSFPNPEEPGALDLAFATAERSDASVVLANDPDADRLAVAVPDPASEARWRRLTGDEVGTVLAHHLLERAQGDRLLVANSIVSSARLGRVATAFGARHEVTLTGFKWLWRAGRELGTHGWRWVMGYEEALGYSLGTAVRDKDGISAAAVVAEIVGGLASDGRTLVDLLAELDDRYGRWINLQRSARFEGDDGPSAMLAAVDRAADVAVDALGVRTIERIVDHRVDDAAAPAWLPSSPLVVWHLAGGGRVLVRPSGTEPKLKLYVDVPLDAADDDAVGQELASAGFAAIGVTA